MKKIILIALLVCIKQVNAQIITTVAGDSIGGYSGDGGQATAAEISNPYKVAFDAVGNMYIADQQNQRIRKINPAGIISTIAGTGTAGFSGDGGPATNAELLSPNGIAVDAFANVFIADMVNNRIRKVNTAGIISTVVGTGPSYGYGGDGGQASAAQLNYPTGLTFDFIGNLYIADFRNNCIRMVNTAGIINTVAGNGTNGYSGDGGPATIAQLYEPSACAVDAAGNLYICDGTNRIRMVNTAGIISTIAGNGIPADSGDGGQATAAEIYESLDIAVGANGNLYIADSGNNRIRMINSTGIITTVVGTGFGAGFGGGFSGDGGQATAAELSNPAGIAFDASGNLYIADAANERIRKVCFNSCAVADIEQFANTNEQISIYPNPSSSIINVELKMKDVGNMQYTLYDINGRAVKQAVIYSLKSVIDVSDLNEGVYNMSIISSEGVVNKRLVIVR